MDKIVSNEDFEKALKNSKNRLIMEKACAPFRRSIDRDELYRCQLMALWNSLSDWNPNRGTQFGSFLYQRVRWTCLKVVNEQKNSPLNNFTIEKTEKKLFKTDELLENLPYDLKDIVIKRYIFGMTLREISEIYQCCHETVRRKIKKALKIVKKNVL